MPCHAAPRGVERHQHGMLQDCPAEQCSVPALDCSVVHIVNNKSRGASGEDFMPIGPIAKNDPPVLDVAARDLPLSTEFDTGT